MTRLPVESWDVLPRLDIPPYELNTICPVTGETSGLEDHHIWRRSFTALGEENADLYWVEYSGPSPQTVHNIGMVVKNRVALSPEAHQRITTNIARLEYRGTDLWYIEGGEEKKLDLNLRLMEGTEKVSKPRRKRTPENPKNRKRLLVHVPADEQNVLPELIDAAREHLAPQMNWDEDVPAYYVLAAALAAVLQT